MAERGTLQGARWVVPPGHVVDLAQRDPASTDGAPGDKDETKADFKRVRRELADLQRPLWAEHRQALLVVLQAMDAGGKDGTIRHVFRRVNPQGCKVVSFKQPNDKERQHDFLWRIHQNTPSVGSIGIFNRSHYEDVLVVRVHDLVPKEVWQERYRIITDFEHNLAAAGTRIVKLFLHISREEQARRFEARRQKAHKRWKFSTSDAEERKHWDAYQEAFAEALTRTSTPEAPWYCIPADKKWFRNWAVANVLVETLRDMDPQFPEPERDIDSVVID